MGELEGVPESAIRAFSTRRESLVEHMEALGTHGFAAARVAALATREAKEQVDLPRLRERWLARAAEHDLGRRRLSALVGHARVAPIELDKVAGRLLGPEGLTAKETTFTMPELVRAVAGALTDGGSADDVLAAAERLAAFPGVELLEPECSPGRPARFTTRELLEVERDALELAVRGRCVGAPQAPPGLVLLNQREMLSPEQRALVRDACLSPDRVVCAVGVAGSGKTTALRVLHSAYREAGIPVVGAAPSGRAADELQAATGIQSTTMHRLLLDAHHAGGVPQGCVLVVDEAGMAETRILAPLLHLVDNAEGKTILVGDPGQLPAVGAGGLYTALCDRLGTIGLTENRRQHDAAERAGLARLRAGDPEPYLAHAAANGRLHLADDATSAKRRLLDDWWQATQSHGGDTIMLAYRRDDMHDLNQAARTLMRHAGRLGADAVQVGEREFRAGDCALCRRNEPQLGLRNGMRGTVTDIDTATNTLTLRTRTGALRQIPPDYASEHLYHAYALTGHAAQGATVDRAHVLLRDGGPLREWGYVACSRARMETRLYLVGEALERNGSTRPRDEPLASTRVAKALERPAAARLAILNAGSGTTDWSPRSRQACEHALAKAEQRLAATEYELRNLGRIPRRRRRAELKAEIARQRLTVKLAQKALAERQLDPIPARSLKPTRPELEGISRTCTNEHNRSIGLDL
jgi:hypothetical protein